MRARRVETVLQWVSDPTASAEWYTRLLGVETEPYAAPYFKFDEPPFDIPPDPDRNIVGLIDNSKGGMPGQT